MPEIRDSPALSQVRHPQGGRLCDTGVMTKHAPPSPTTAEIELKLLLPGAQPDQIEALLAQHPLLAAQAPQRRWLWNRYFDTPDLDLQRQRAALRVRRSSAQADTTASDSWVQTLKTAGQSQGGLSQRGEWNTPVADGHLDPVALQALAAWNALDADGAWLAQLQPCFETRCRRSTWHVTHNDGSVVEVALDVGDIVAGEHNMPMLELELELLSGQPGALLDLAQALAQQVAVLPCDVSKAERGYALAEGSVYAPVRARTVTLGKKWGPQRAAAQVLGEVLEQFTRNLAALCHADHPELVHQARVAWRRWRSIERLLRPWLAHTIDRTPLRPLLQALGALRDLDVAGTETLPLWATAFANGHPRQARALQRAQTALDKASQQRRAVVRQLLATPDIGLALLGMARWLHGMGLQPANASHPAPRDWAHARVAKLRRRLRTALRAVDKANAQASAAVAQTELAEMAHEARLLAKRTRYNLEAFSSLLPPKTTRRWGLQAKTWQTRIGQSRDLVRAIELLHELQVAPELVAFLRGVAAGQATP